MPMTIKITEGVVPTDAEPKMADELTAAFLEVNGATGNPFLAPNFPVIIMTIPAAKCYLDGKPAKFAQVEFACRVSLSQNSPRRRLGSRRPPISCDATREIGCLHRTFG